MILNPEDQNSDYDGNTGPDRLKPVDEWLWQMDTEKKQLENFIEEATVTLNLVPSKKSEGKARIQDAQLRPDDEERHHSTSERPVEAVGLGSHSGSPTVPGRSDVQFLLTLLFTTFLSWFFTWLFT